MWLLLGVWALAACGGASSSSDAAVADAGDAAAADARVDAQQDARADGGSCGVCPCPSGLSCRSGVCQNGKSAWVPYGLAALRANASLDIHVTFTPTGGAPQELTVGDARLSCPAVEVPWSGEGSYVATLRDDDPWWATAPLALSRSRNVADVLAEGSSASLMSQTYQDMGWGLWQNAIGANSAAQLTRRQAFIDAGVPVLGYLEGTGNLFVFLATIDNPPKTIGSTDVTATGYTHWSWGNWSGSLPANQQVIWMGAHTYYDAPSYAGPYTRKHPLYGDAIPVTDPSGQPISSPPAAVSDPRQHGLYRQCGATDINGEPHLDLGLQGSRNVSGLPGVLGIGGKDYSLLGLARDPACPTWLRYHDASLRYAVAQGTKGCWMDNVSLWDAFGLVPADAAFGAHANARFEAFVVASAPAGFLTRSGLQAHVGAMNMRCIVKWKARTGFGDNVGAAGLCSSAIAMNQAGLMDARWDADLAWGAYLAHTVQIHVDHYQGMRKTLDQLDPGFLWGVNDLPNYGAVVGETVAPSMNLSELVLGPHIIFGGTRVPPAGSLAPLYDLAGAFDRAQFQSVWLYVDEPGLEDSAGLHHALAAEALAYDTFLMPSAEDVRAPGTTTSAGVINVWLKPHAAELEGRKPWTNVGLVFSADSWLRAFRPGGVPSVTIPDGAGTRQVRDFSQQHAFSGWHLVLQREHVQAQPLLAGRLKAGDLDGYQLIVLPDTQVISAALRDSVLTPWVKAGGTLVITGRSGRYQGREAMFEPWSPTLAAGAPPVGFAALSGVANLDSVKTITSVSVGSGKVVIVPATPAADAWLGRGSSKIDAVLAFLQTQALLPGYVLDAPAASNVLVRLHTDRPRGRLFIDLVNRNWSAATQKLTALGAQSLRVALPSWLRGLAVTARTAAKRGQATASVTAQGDAVAVTVDSVEDIVTIIVEANTL